MTAGTRQGRLRRHFVIGSSPLDRTRLPSVRQVWQQSGSGKAWAGQGAVTAPPGKHCAGIRAASRTPARWPRPGGSSPRHPAKPAAKGQRPRSRFPARSSGTS